MFSMVCRMCLSSMLRTHQYVGQKNGLRALVGCGTWSKRKAELSTLNRESLYRLVSRDGHPRWTSLREC